MTRSRRAISIVACSVSHGEPGKGESSSSPVRSPSPSSAHTQLTEEICIAAYTRNRRRPAALAVASLGCIMF